MAEQDEQTEREPIAGQDPRVGDTWEDMTDVGTPGPQRRVGVLEIEGGRAHVENKSTRVRSWVGVEKFEPPNWRFIG